MKRIAYVGLSSPIFYDYANEARKCASDRSSSPNPILDGPVGLMLLFDEIWFLCESLCPQNMRGLNYVKFLDQTKELDGFQFDNDSVDLFFTDEQKKAQTYHFANYNQLVFEKGVHWHKATDNHSHSLKINGLDPDLFHFAGNSMNYANVVFDLCMVNHLGRGVELVTNLFTESLFRPNVKFVDSDITQSILIRDIPNFLTPLGPYSSCIEEVRNNKFIGNFRSWISNQTGHFDHKETQEIIESVERTIEEEKERVFYKYLDPKDEVKSVGKTTIGFFADFILPGASPILDLVGQYRNAPINESKRWQGFVSNAHRVFGKQ